MKNNGNAIKWTEEEAVELYDYCEEIIDDQTTYIVKDDELEGYEFDFIGELIKALKKKYKDKKIYRKLLADHLPSRFEGLALRYLQLKEDLESNCYSNTKKGIINTAVGIVNLKSNHNWTDRLQSDHTTKGDKLQTQFIVGTKEHGDEVKDFVNDIKENKE